MNKLLISAAAAAALAFATAASAQTEQAAEVAYPSQCGELPTAPTLPDGASANNSAMEQGNAAYTAWGQQVQTVLACQRAEAERLNQVANERTAQYNAGAQQLNAVTQSWQAEVAEYNGRSGESSSSRRESGSLAGVGGGRREN